MSEILSPTDSYMEALAEFAAGAGHEINNPLATILGRVQLLLANEENSTRLNHLHQIGSQAFRIRDMISDIMLYARPPAPVYAEIHVEERLEEVVENYKTYAHRQKVFIDLKCRENLVLNADKNQFLTAVTELVRNACEASEVNSEIVVEALPHSVQNVCVVRVIDHGCGFNDEEKRHLFDPFYSGRQAGRGHGFGLCKCWRIMNLHDGRIEIETQNGLTIASLFWPIQPPL